MKTPLSHKSLLMVVDYQNDFASPDGALYVPGGETIKGTIEKLVQLFIAQGQEVLFSADYHPQNHISFASRFGLPPFSTLGKDKKRPDHCVADTHGAEFHGDFNPQNKVLKGTKRDVDSYSAFGGDVLLLQGNAIALSTSHSLDHVLKQNGIEDIYIVGLATDYCVGETALDSQKNGYTTHLITDAIKGVNEEKSITMIQSLHNVILQTSTEVMQEFQLRKSS